MEERVNVCACVSACVCPPPSPGSCPRNVPQQERTEDPRPQPPCPNGIAMMSAAFGFVQSTSVLLILTQEFHFGAVTASSGSMSQASYGLPGPARPQPCLPALHSQPQPSPCNNRK